MASRRCIKELQDRERVEEVYLCLRKLLPVDRNGRRYLTLTLGDRSLLEHVIARNRDQAAAVLVSCGEKARQLPPSLQDLPTTLDAFPGQGPLAGIESLLEAATTEWLVALPCDMPWVDGALLDDLVAATAEDGAVGATFTVDGRRQPLPILVHREVLPRLRSSLQSQRNSVLGPTDAGGFAEVPLDPSKAPRWLANLNRPEDFDAAVVDFAKSSAQGRGQPPFGR